jgi:mono/diheme cytochrome c family protein
VIPPSRNPSRWLAAIGALLVITAFVSSTSIPSSVAAPVVRTNKAQVAQGSRAQILLGRQMILEHACSECHGGMDNPAAQGWLAGVMTPDQEFQIGPCAVTPGAQPCFITRPKNLTPDNETGIGKFSERQIFNALRYGLRPEETPDVAITSSTPGKGNFPASPHYLAPPMPWPAWRRMSDEQLWAIAAYLKRGVKPVSNKVKDSDRPPDAWAGEYSTPQKYAPYPAVAYPTMNEQAVAAASRKLVMRGRDLVMSHDCGACHGTDAGPGAKGWLAGNTHSGPEYANPQQEFKIGPCALNPGAQPCFITRAKNLTPDNSTGTGKFSERQIFNALRYGLRPEETPDVTITSTTPGKGNFPTNPHYLAPPMPWTSWRHMPDADLWAIAAYIKRGVKPVKNQVMDSEGPPDFWASAYTPQAVGTHPAPAYPTVNEK